MSSEYELFDYWKLKGEGGLHEIQWDAPYVLNCARCLYWFNEFDKLLPYLKEHYDQMAGAHILPFMTERNMDDFPKYIKELLEWAIYDDSNQKFVNNMVCIFEDEQFAPEIRNIAANARTYISKFNVYWPEPEDFVWVGDISSAQSILSISDAITTWVNWSIMEYDITQTIPEFNWGEMYGDVERFYKPEDRTTDEMYVEPWREVNDYDETTGLYTFFAREKAIIGTMKEQKYSKIGSSGTSMSTGNGTVKLSYVYRPSTYTSRID